MLPLVSLINELKIHLRLIRSEGKFKNLFTCSSFHRAGSMDLESAPQPRSSHTTITTLRLALTLRTLSTSLFSLRTPKTDGINNRFPQYIARSFHTETSHGLFTHLATVQLQDPSSHGGRMARDCETRFDRVLRRQCHSRLVLFHPVANFVR